MKPLWDASLVLGSAQIDSEHQGVFASIELLLESLAEGDAARSRACLEAAAAQFRQNFESEDRLMEAVAYPRASEHREGHTLFWKDLEELRGQLERRGVVPVFALWVQSRMVQWLRFHIGTHDGPLVRYANRRPAAASPPAVPAQEAAPEERAARSA